ncbi:MAG: radical SAM protein [Planctomycetota bacterium]
MSAPGDLTAEDHDRGAAERRLVYPVLSRRAGGLSIGVNLNPGKECNWACVYCEVDGLVRGAPGPVDLEVLERELDGTLAEAAAGRWTAGGQPAPVRDVSIAGDGEPTLSPQFAGAVDVCARLREAHGLAPGAGLVTITNGSRLHVPEVAEGVRRLGAAGGELWFKLDGGTPEARGLVNQVEVGDARVVENLAAASAACPTWVQCMVLAVDGEGPTREDVDARVELVRRARDLGAEPAGVVVYGLARPSMQPDGHRLRPLEAHALEAIGRRFEALDLPVRLVV